LLDPPLVKMSMSAKRPSALLVAGLLVGAVAAPAESQQAAPDVTLRYYGSVVGLARHSSSSPWFPTSTCADLSSICVGLRVGECSAAPAELSAPFTTRSLTGSNIVQSGVAKSEFLLLEKSEDAPGGFVLWSQCEEGCGDCREREGYSMEFAPEDINRCGRSISGRLFMLQGGQVESDDGHCVASLSESYQSARASEICKDLRALGIAFGVLALLVCQLLRGGVLRRGKRGEVAPFTEADVERQAPAVVLSSTSGVEGATCVICLSDIKQGDKCRSLRCSHHFHADCIAKWWISRHKSASMLECPCCRQPHDVQPSSTQVSAEP